MAVRVQSRFLIIVLGLAAAPGGHSGKDERFSPVRAPAPAGFPSAPRSALIVSATGGSGH